MKWSERTVEFTCKNEQVPIILHVEHIVGIGKHVPISVYTSYGMFPVEESYDKVISLIDAANALGNVRVGEVEECVDPGFYAGNIKQSGYYTNDSGTGLPHPMTCQCDRCKAFLDAPGNLPLDPAGPFDKEVTDELAREQFAEKFKNYRGPGKHDIKFCGCDICKQVRAKKEIEKYGKQNDSNFNKTNGGA